MKEILIKPLITEKMTNITADKGKYGFLVNNQSNKIEIAKAIEKKFNVHVLTVRTINYPGKLKTQFRKSGRFVGRTASYKKAVVTLKKGETIELFEQV
ncbi:MAG: 50S ribosomal protein L23 [Ignavibacteria bacterium RIFOXYB2_FULL_35_12]|nr:MAG: 50S ribosomal protein L23 [Ignavibacteria bacterium GWC2_35_8]OGU59916.1 MAG: 50S ribosomal protein L23 [Ignavibacteria bacterium GWF2_35_20]OGU80134.1 MAG: 50S ribosomal protein L23 [Ignavibacteria bacterium RIFOXYA2_FULL_35_9]OGU81994.1 MAG: 50S ribosomal protein L23 [Ignavibacteria bacterium RBG_16_35_7]OGU85380.1 MAG: 50S ribosomal protein L23 [Ignavibacteria bacterium RIFOXYA12_FULL_35_25]OGU89265.1 MAG: 50S ribosomal protein L23 [Ignavibacteria bacterium RIFOXYC12_FULL_35_11]OGU